MSSEPRASARAASRMLVTVDRASDFAQALACDANTRGRRSIGYKVTYLVASAPVPDVELIAPFDPSRAADEQVIRKTQIPSPQNAPGLDSAMIPAMPT